MYLTSQRVSSPGSERSGINTLLYRHEQPVPGVDWSQPDLVRIAEQFPGTLIAHATDVPPGGNLIHSYLDIAAADTTIVEEVDTALQRLAQEWASAQVGAVRHVGKVALRLYLGPKVVERAMDELWELGQRALGLLRAPVHSEWAANEPLQVLVTAGEHSRSYVLDEPSRKRLQSVQGPGWTSTQVTLSPGTTATTSNPVDLGLHVAPLLTGLPLEELAPLGGIRFVEASSRTMLWEWPHRAPLAGYCLNCHQHNTLHATRSGFQCASCGNLQDTDGLWAATLS